MVLFNARNMNATIDTTKSLMQMLWLGLTVLFNARNKCNPWHNKNIALARTDATNHWLNKPFTQQTYRLKDNKMNTNYHHNQLMQTIMLNGNQRNAQCKGNAQWNKTTMINVPHNKMTEECNHHSRKTGARMQGCNGQQ